MADKKEEEVAPGKEQGIGELDTSKWEEQPTVTGRPNDTPQTEQKPALPNSTFGSRKKATSTSSAKAVKESDTEDKAVGRARSTTKKASS